MRFRIVSILACTAVFVGLFVGVAVARSPAITRPATTVKHRSATLQGLVDAGPTGAAWLFEYGTTKALGSYSSTKTIGSGKASVSHTLHHLQPGTTYYFRLVVIQGGYIPVTSYGAKLQFRTKHY